MVLSQFPIYSTYLTHLLRDKYPASPRVPRDQKETNTVWDDFLVVSYFNSSPSCRMSLRGSGRSLLLTMKCIIGSLPDRVLSVKAQILIYGFLSSR